MQPEATGLREEPHLRQARRPITFSSGTAGGQGASAAGTEPPSRATPGIWPRPWRGGRASN